MCLKNYKLAHAYYYTSPGLSWDACLKYTDISLELLTDIDMLLMFERGIRGGINQAVFRHAEANNKYMETYDSSKESSYLQYLDANNLYGWAMSEKLPTGGFEWVNLEGTNYETEKINKRISKLAKDEDTGYLLEVDVDYPEELHERHNDLPFLVERLEINKIEKLVQIMWCI